MKVKCVRVLISNSPRSISDSGWANVEQSLTKGCLYTVLAIDHRRECDWYLICDDSYNDMSGYNYPVYVPSLFFLIKDHYKPSNWRISLDGSGYEGPPELSYEYYEKIVDGDPYALASFRRILYEAQDPPNG